MPSSDQVWVWLSEEVVCILLVGKWCSKIVTNILGIAWTC
jgi:hypothetical protein